MFNALLIAHDDSACVSMENLAIESRQVYLEKSLSRFPRARELANILNSRALDLVFLDLSDWESALAAATDIHEVSPRTAIIGFGGGWNARQEAQCAAAGVTELLVSPVNLKRYQDAVDRAIHKMTEAIQENLFAFLPSKAGSGTTTVALNTAGYLANPLDRKVLLIDGDLNSGVVSVMLDLKHSQSLRDALENSSQLDYSHWARLAIKAQGIDLLVPDHPRRTPLPSWSNYHHLLDFAASRYDNILVDLPEVVNDATVETVRRAKQVFVVCTPELASLALAPHRIEEMIGRGIPSEKISLVVNRWHKGEISASDLEDRLKRPVSAVFGNDYREVSRAAAAHGLVSRDSKLGKSFATFARKLAGAPEESSSASGALSFLKGFGARPVVQPHA